MTDTIPFQGWSELLLALPEFDLIDAHVHAAGELHAVVELSRVVRACPSCGVRDPMTAGGENAVTAHTSKPRAPYTTSPNIIGA